MGKTNKLGSPGRFNRSQSFVQTDATIKLDKMLFREQANRLRHQPKAVTRVTRGLCTKWPTRLPLGLVVTEGQRDTKLQSRFQDLIRSHLRPKAQPIPSLENQKCGVLFLADILTRVQSKRPTHSDMH